uniref:F-box domain-containing protein n=1 Tax=Triticum urartu TaxID=4572 RepID=A0A8R7VGP8_TRIUA
MEAETEGTFERRNTKPRLDDHPGATAASLILEILSRLPARSVHRFKCVSVLWRDLIAANRNKLPHTLAGFLYRTIRNARRHHFASVSGGAIPFDPCLQPNKYKDMTQVDSCNGLLLYRSCANRDDFRLVVCNPATGRWVELPPKPQAPASTSSRTIGLAFDPAVSPHFHVLCFEQTLQETYMTGVNIYSSQTGAWSLRDSGTVEKVTLFLGSSKCVSVGGMLYLNGKLHVRGDFVLVGVDMEGKVWTTTPLPYPRMFGMIGSSQGCLHYAIPPADDNNGILFSKREIWCLKDRNSKELVLKHTANIDKLMTGHSYRVVGIHPDCDTIFLISYEDDTLVSYDMLHQKVDRIVNLEKDDADQFLPYVPLFSESLAD